MDPLAGVMLFVAALLNRVTDSSLTDDALCLSFERVSVAISLRAEDYRGPEAFYLSRPSSPMLVV